MPRLSPKTLIILVCALLAVVAIGAGVGWLAHVLLQGAWQGLGLHETVFPGMR